jgi:hypothetical protein
MKQNNKVVLKNNSLLLLLLTNLTIASKIFIIDFSTKDP